MGFISKLIGAKNNFHATQAGYLNPVNQAQVGQAYNGASGAVDQQQAFLNALKGQNGLGNQASVFGQQQALANQLQQQANGGGPNPALAQLNQQTGNNIASQAALMAGQRGAGANAGLLARQAALQGGALQQQAVGQEATLQSQQQIAAQQALQNQQAQMANLANTQVSNQAQGVNALNQASQGLYGQQLQGAQIGNQNQTAINEVNSGVASQNANTNKGIAGGLLGGIASATGLIPGKAHGGEVKPESNAVRHLLGMQPDYMEGGQIPGKPMMKGDHPQNDKVPIMTSPGEVVIPNSIMQSKDPIKGAAEFVRQVMAKKKDKPKANFDEGGEVADAQDTVDQEASLPSFVPEIGAAQASAQLNLQNAEDNAPNAPTAPQGIDLNGLVSKPNKPSPFMQDAQGGAPQPQGQGAEVGGMGIGGQGDVATSYLSAINRIQKGQKQEAQALGQQGKAEQAILSKSSDQLKAQQQKFDLASADLDQHRQALMNDIQNGHIDPNHFIGSMGTPQRISTAIGLILGGISGGLTGKENPASVYLQKQIDNDIMAQKEDLGKKQSLLDANFRQYGNMRDAMSMTKANMLDVSSLEMKAAAAKAQDPLAQARLLQEAGKLDAQAASVIAPMKQKQQVLRAISAGNVDPSQAVQFLVPKEHQQKVFGEIQQSQDASNSEQSILNQFEKARKENTVAGRAGRAGFTPPSVKALNALFDPLIHDQVGRVNEFEKQDLQNLIPSPGDKESTVEAKKQALVDFINHKKSAPTAKGYGIDLDKFQSTTTNPYAKLNPQIKSFVDWAKQNPNDPRAAMVLKKAGL